jgi:hypothetical protein
MGMGKTHYEAAIRQMGGGESSFVNSAFVIDKSSNYLDLLTFNLSTILNY